MSRGTGSPKGRRTTHRTAPGSDDHQGTGPQRPRSTRRWRALPGSGGGTAGPSVLGNRQQDVKGCRVEAIIPHAARALSARRKRLYCRGQKALSPFLSPAPAGAAAAAPAAASAWADVGLVRVALRKPTAMTEGCTPCRRRSAPPAGAFRATACSVRRPLAPPAPVPVVVRGVAVRRKVGARPRTARRDTQAGSRRDGRLDRAREQRRNRPTGPARCSSADARIRRIGMTCTWHSFLLDIRNEQGEMSMRKPVALRLCAALATTALAAATGVLVSMPSASAAVTGSATGYATQNGGTTGGAGGQTVRATTGPRSTRPCAAGPAAAPRSPSRSRAPSTTATPPRCRAAVATPLRA